MPATETCSHSTVRVELTARDQLTPHLFIFVVGAGEVPHHITVFLLPGHRNILHVHVRLRGGDRGHVSGVNDN